LCDIDNRLGDLLVGKAARDQTKEIDLALVERRWPAAAHWRSSMAGCSEHQFDERFGPHPCRLPNPRIAGAWVRSPKTRAGSIVIATSNILSTPGARSFF
jgi:hypothetical protein